MFGLEGLALKWSCLAETFFRILLSLVIQRFRASIHYLRSAFEISVLALVRKFE